MLWVDSLTALKVQLSVNIKITQTKIINADCNTTLLVILNLLDCIICSKNGKIKTIKCVIKYSQNK